MSSSVGLLTTLDFDNIVELVLLKGWLVNFFIWQIPPTNLDRFFLLAKDFAEFFLVLVVVLSELRRNGEELEIFRLHLGVDAGS